MTLIETKIYKTKVGLFIQKFNEVSSILNSEEILLPESEVMYDQNHEGWHIFHVMRGKNEYVKVPDYDLDNEIEEV